MSREHVSSFVSDLVTMAQAMERLPEVQAELESALNVVGTQADAIQRLELRIIDLKNISDTHLATIRTLEVARDDAELRFLEADERTTQALAFVRTVFGNAGSLIQALDPPRVAEPKASEPVAQPKSEWSGSPDPARPDTHWIDDNTGQSIAAEPATQEPVSVQASPIPTTISEPASTVQGDMQSSGQSEPDPLPTSGAKATPDGSGSDATSHTADTALATPTSEAAQPTPPGPYSGRRYIDVPHYVSLDNWTAGGGTVDDYYASRKPNLAV